MTTKTRSLFLKIAVMVLVLVFVMGMFVACNNAPAPEGENQQQGEGEGEGAGGSGSATAASIALNGATNTPVSSSLTEAELKALIGPISVTFSDQTTRSISDYTLTKTVGDNGLEVVLTYGGVTKTVIIPLFDKMQEATYQNAKAIAKIASGEDITLLMSAVAYTGDSTDAGRIVINRVNGEYQFGILNSEAESTYGYDSADAVVFADGMGYDVTAITPIVNSSLESMLQGVAALFEALPAFTASVDGTVEGEYADFIAALIEEGFFTETETGYELLVKGSDLFTIYELYEEYFGEEEAADDEDEGDEVDEEAVPSILDMLSALVDMLDETYLGGHLNEIVINEEFITDFVSGLFPVDEESESSLYEQMFTKNELIDIVAGLVGENVTEEQIEAAIDMIDAMLLDGMLNDPKNEDGISIKDALGIVIAIINEYTDGALEEGISFSEENIDSWLAEIDELFGNFLSENALDEDGAKAFDEEFLDGNVNSERFAFNFVIDLASMKNSIMLSMTLIDYGAEEAEEAEEEDDGLQEADVDGDAEIIPAEVYGFSFVLSLVDDAVTVVPEEIELFDQDVEINLALIYQGIDCEADVIVHLGHLLAGDKEILNVSLASRSVEDAVVIKVVGDLMYLDLTVANEEFELDLEKTTFVGNLADLFVVEDEWIEEEPIDEEPIDEDPANVPDEELGGEEEQGEEEQGEEEAAVSPLQMIVAMLSKIFKFVEYPELDEEREVTVNDVIELSKENLMPLVFQAMGALGNTMSADEDDETGDRTITINLINDDEELNSVYDIIYTFVNLPPVEVLLGDDLVSAETKAAIEAMTGYNYEDVIGGLRLILVDCADPDMYYLHLATYSYDEEEEEEEERYVQDNPFFTFGINAKVFDCDETAIEEVTEEMIEAAADIKDLDQSIFDLIFLPAQEAEVVPD